MQSSLGAAGSYGTGCCLIRNSFMSRWGGILKSVTVSKDTDGRYYASILFSYPEDNPAHTLDRTKAVGLDMSMKELYRDSNDYSPRFPRPYGNHENFEALNRYPVSEWNGGKVHIIRPNIIHLMRGQIFTIEKKTFFTFGGGISIDKCRRMPYVSWWPEEEPSTAEINEAFNNLEQINYKVDYVITHAAPESIMRNDLCKIHPMLMVDCATEKLLNEIYQKLDFKMWFCGHYHMDSWIHSCKLQVLYNYVIKLADGYPIASRLD